MKASNWLTMLEKSHSNLTLNPLLQILLAKWTVGQAVQSRKMGVHGTAKRLVNYIESECQRDISTLGSVDAALVLLCLGVVRKLGLHSPSLEGYAIRCAETIKAETSINVDPYFCTYLLTRLGLLQHKPSKKTMELQIELGNDWFRADQVFIYRISKIVAYSTKFGKAKPNLETNTLAYLKAGVEMWMLNSLYRYNLELGSLLLRDMIYLRMRKEQSFREGLGFIVTQQQFDGRFGFFGPEISKLHSIRSQFNEDLELYLPITLSCLWTIAESKGSFLLFDSFGD